jgi:hypothetical protein
MKNIASVACTVFLAVAARAQTQVATVTSSAPFTLRDAGITPGQGVPMWPVLAGDVVKAGNTLAIVTFPDGSVVMLAPGSEGKIDFVNGKRVFQLLGGTARYSLKSTVAVQLMEASQTVTPTDLLGTLTLGGNKAAAAGLAGGGFWTAGHIAAVVVVGAATAAGLGFAVSEAVKGGAAVSPSQ